MAIIVDCTICFYSLVKSSQCIVNDVIESQTRDEQTKVIKFSIFKNFSNTPLNPMGDSLCDARDICTLQRHATNNYVLLQN